MAAEDRILKILLQLRADVADSAKVTGALKEIEVQAVKTSAAVSGAGQPASLFNKQPGFQGYTVAEQAQIAALISGTKVEAAGLATNFGMAGVNLARAKQEAIVLMREIAAGNIRASTLSSLLGSMGTAFTISGIAAYSLYQILDSAAHKSLLLAQETRKQTDELVRQLTTWNELAQAASDFGDVIKLGEKIEPELTKASQKLEEFRNKELGAFKLLADSIASQWSGIPGYGPHPFQEGKDKQTDSQASALRSLTVEAAAWIETAQQAADAWQNLKLGPLDDAITKQGALVDEAKAKYAALGAEVHKLAVGNLDDTGTAKLVADLKKLDETGKNIELQTKRLDELTKTATKLSTETDKVAEALKKIDLGELNNPQKLEDFSTQILGIQARLLELGVAAESPNEALEKSKTITAEVRQEVIKLIAEWAKLLGLIVQTNQAEEDDARKAKIEAINVMLREHATLLMKIREQQQLINANPFLSADDKQKLTAVSMIAELAELKAAIADTEKELSKIGLDPAKQAQLQADLKKDQFEFKLLTEKVRGMSFGGQIGADLVTWVNSFGTAAHQVAGIITNVLGTAIDGIAQATTGLILGTESYKQAWNQAAASVIQSIVKVVVQFIAGQIAMFVIRQIFGKQEQTTANQAAVESAAAWAPAAISASIASEGSAAGLGVAAYIAALAVGDAAAIGIASAGAGAGGGGGGYKKGGYTGAGHEDEIAGPAHKGEFYFSKSETESIGLRNLYAMKHAAPHFGDGGPVLPTDREWTEPGILPGNLGDYSGPSYGGDPSGAGMVSPYLFDPATGEPIVQVNWRGQGSAPYWNQPATSPGAGSPFGGGIAGGAGAGSPFGGAAGGAGFGIGGQSLYTSSMDYATKAFLLGGGYVGSPNRMPVSDSGRTHFDPRFSIGHIGEEGFIVRTPTMHLKPFGHGADGLRIPGPASKADNILAWLSTGERVIPAERNILFEKKFGFDWDRKLAIERPHFAAGGVAGGSSSSRSSVSASSVRPVVNVALFDDPKKALKWLDSQEGEKIFMDMINRNRHDLALPATQ